MSQSFSGGTWGGISGSHGWGRSASDHFNATFGASSGGGGYSTYSGPTSFGALYHGQDLSYYPKENADTLRAKDRAAREAAAKEDAKRHQTQR